MDKEDKRGKWRKSEDEEAQYQIQQPYQKCHHICCEKWVKKRMKALDHEKDDGKEVEAYIMQIIQKASVNQKTSVSGTTWSTTTIRVPGKLKSIIKWAKNQNGVCHAPDLQVSSLSSKRRIIIQPDSKTIWDTGINHDPDKIKNPLK